jgi:nucleotide-binding universal stress UspA family protein
MAYKNILVHLNNEGRVARLIGAAMQLALPDNSHLTGLFVVPAAPARSPLLSILSGGAMQKAFEAYRETGRGIRKAFEDATARQPVVAEWRLHETAQPSYVDAALEKARAADLVIAAQKENDWDYADMFDVPGWLAMESGRPVLVIPGAGGLAPIGKRVLVAWNNSRESTRAVFDALPILKRANEVTVLVVEETGKPETMSGHASDEICATMVRHGVKCTTEQVKPIGAVEPGVELLAQTAAHKCDLLVMGCYGHSRFREFVLGGASRYVLQHTSVPVLMAN